MIETISYFDEVSCVIKNKFRMKFQKKTKSPLLGLVRIFENDKLNIDQTPDGWLTNMTISKGREFVAQAITKKNSLSSSLGEIYNYKVDSFGVGSGGSSIDIANNVTLNGPQLCDIGLYAPLFINTNCISAVNNANVQVNNTVKKIESVGPIGNIAGTIEFETSNSITFAECPYYTVIKNTCILDSSEPSNLEPCASVRIDEAMLYLTSTTDTNPIPFAHICFAPKFIEKETIFKIEWYIIC